MKILVIIDMQNDFLMTEGALSLKIEPNWWDHWHHLLHQHHFDRYLYSFDWHQEGDKEFDLFPLHCLQHTWGSRLVAPLQIHYEDQKNNGVAEVFYKNSYVSDELINRLIFYLYKGAHIYFSGVCTSICVENHIAQLIHKCHQFSFSYHIDILPSYTRDVNPDSHKQALDRIQKIYGVNLCHKL